ncbi:phosphomannomutase/phosphoglucomutase [Candidatus Gottesmanbacteria bacterium]|nr:phosphomannomutase/phosphoglucomutase [Candidatus Gottesmanbacteria bacterium]
MNIDPKIFKDYDVRGTYPDQVNGEVAKEIAYALVKYFQPKTIAICRDMRLSGQEIKDNLVEVFTKLGIDVFDAGLGGTEMQYFIAGTMPYDLVLMISASHNPPEYNGLKVVKKGPIAVTSDSGLYAVRDLILSGDYKLPDAKTAGKVKSIDVVEDWKKKILSLVDVLKIKPLSVVVDAGNGMAGKLVPPIFEDLPVKLTSLYFDLDGSFPNHVPNPLIEKNNQALISKIMELNADMGFTFDGDADRMFVIDDKGRLVSGTITTSLIAEYLLRYHPREMVLYNAICGRIVPQVIDKNGGTSKRVRVGHSYIKTYMRETNAIFAGEHSGHYYYRDYFCAESGVLSALYILSLVSEENRKLSELVDELSVYPASGEINFVVSDIPKITENIKIKFKDAKSIDELDGISVWYDNYWFNVRASKTEPLMRLNLEADNQEILNQKTNEVISFIESMGGKKKE